MLMVNGEKVTNVLHTILPFRTYRYSREVGVSSLCVCVRVANWMQHTQHHTTHHTDSFALWKSISQSRIAPKLYTHRHTTYWRRTYFIQRDIFRHTYALWAFITMLCVAVADAEVIYLCTNSANTIHHRRHRWSPPLPTPSSFEK